MNFRQRLARFFWGRYGIDQLYYALLLLYVVLAVILAFPISLIVRALLSVLQSVVVVYIFFRILSRNHAARRRENDAFLKVWKPVKNKLVLLKNVIRDFKGYRYRTCPNCKATLRLPKRKGEHNVVCPCCKQRFSVRVRF